MKISPRFGLAAALLLAMAACGTARADTTVEAAFTLSLGGQTIGQGQYSAMLAGDEYRLHGGVAIAGAPEQGNRPLFSGTAESFGTIRGDRLEVNGFSAGIKGGKSPQATALDAARLRGFIDPLGMILLPMMQGGDPCARTLHVFDGKHQFDLILKSGRPSRYRMAADGSSRTGVRCSAQFTPRKGFDKDDPALPLRMQDGVLLWLTPVNGGSAWMPLRVQVRFGNGALTVDVTRFVQRD